MPGRGGCRGDLTAVSGVRWGSHRCRAQHFPARPRRVAVALSASGCMSLLGHGLLQGFLNEHWFLPLADARSKTEAQLRFYNEERPAVHWRGTPLRNSPENTYPKRVPWRQKRTYLYRLMASQLGAGQSANSRVWRVGREIHSLGV